MLPGFPSRSSAHVVRSMLIGLLLSTPALLADGLLGKDLPDGQDHPMISRYAGSTLIGYDRQKYTGLRLLLGPAIYTSGRFGAAKEQNVEGQVTRLLYVAPAQRSVLEVFRNYEQELTKHSFQTLYSCVGEPCGPIADAVYPRERYLRYRNRGSVDLGEHAFTSGAREAHYLALRHKDPMGDAYVSLLIGKPSCCPEYVKAFGLDTLDRVHVLLEIVETKQMSTGLVTVSASMMASDIARLGHTVLYGIYFDTGKDTLKPESDPAMQEIGKLLKSDPGLKLHVVGHTDNVGALDANMALSDRRAAAVVKELTTKYGIAAARLRGSGVGSLAPVAANTNEEGRAKNRRVELVTQ